MRRPSPAILAAVAASVAVLGWAVWAIVAGSPDLGLSGSSAGGPSPACLPATLDRSAALPGTSIDVSPAPGTGTANPHTQISFLGVPGSEIHGVSVAGSASGSHRGRLAPYSQGDGASFLPAAPFRPGERVTVRAAIGGPTGARQMAFGFRVDTPYPTEAIPPFPNPPASPADYQSFDTLPGVQAPVLTVTVPDRAPAAGDVFTTNGPGPGRYGPLIYTPQGRLVWFHQLPGGVSAENLAVQTYGSQRDLTFWQGKVLSLGFGEGEDLVMSSSYQTVARVVGGNGLRADLHDFQLAPRGVSYSTAYNPIRCDLSHVGGARGGTIIDTAVQETDMRTGLVRWEWHSLDHVGPGESQTAAPANASPWDWFHLNSIDLQPGPGGRVARIFISARSTWASYELQGGTGKILWRLGGSHSSFTMGPGTQTAWQHDGRILPDGEITLFDDGSNPPVHSQSRALRIALDFRTHRARLRAAYVHDSPLLSVSQGNAQTLLDGSTVVGYGSIPQISQYAAGGALLFDAQLPVAMDSYRVFRFPWNARPASPPAATASLNNTGEETIVHASWNGATGVASWRALAGEAPVALSPRATFAASGFESSTVLPKTYAWVQLQALDSAGRALASSRPVRVSSHATASSSAGGPR